MIVPAATRGKLNVPEPATDTTDMPRVPVIDRLLGWLFGIVRQLFLLQGLAFGCASAASVAWVSRIASPWMTRVLITAVLISASFVAAGLVLGRLRSWSRVRDVASDAAGSKWPTALAVSLVAMSGLALVASMGLPSLWREIGAQLTAVGFWNELSGPSQFGGIVFIPIVLALFIPALVTASALFSFVFPLVLVARLPSRPLLFPTLLSMGAVCQTALVATGWLATKLLHQISEVVATEMTKAPDTEVRQLATRLTMAVETLTITAAMLMLGVATIVAWAIFLRPSGRAASTFGRDSENDSVELLNLGGSHKEEPFVSFSAEAGESPARSAPKWRGAIGGWALIGLGVVLLLFAAMDSLRARPSFVASSPEPGATLAATPSAVRVSLSHPLHSSSTLSVVYLPIVPDEDDIAKDVRLISRLATDDTERRTLEATVPRLGRGLYLVRWTANPEGGGVIRHGSFTFGIGAAVPPDRADMTYSLDQRDSNSRGRRSSLLGGVVLLVIGALASFRVSIDQPRT
jgi:methionine-rich copper-binding protein CopC